jgi:2-C-methyl-D-erythritol 4-phosphate cytidylyltransferase
MGDIMEMGKTTAVVLAAGKGKRMHTSVAKQFLKLRDKPVLYYSLKAFEDSDVDEIVLVAGSDQVEYCREHIVTKYHISKVVQVIEGGKERYDSVYRALKYIQGVDYVLIHDGARPFIMSQQIDHIIRQVKEYKACMFGTPVKETVKVVNREEYIESTLDRNTLWTAQTPQAFSYASIRKAYDLFNEEVNRDGLPVTDDAMVYETYLKKPVKMIQGDYHNLKITTVEDLILAKALMDDKRIIEKALDIM